MCLGLNCGALRAGALPTQPQATRVSRSNILDPATANVISPHPPPRKSRQGYCPLSQYYGVFRSARRLSTLWFSKSKVTLQNGGKGDPSRRVAAADRMSVR